MSALEQLPLELLRLVLSFCSDGEVVRVLPKISKRFRDACHDCELLRGFLRRELGQFISTRPIDDIALGPGDLSGGDDWHSWILNRVIASVDLASRSYHDPPAYWARWIVALQTMRNTSGSGNKVEFGALLNLMQFLPHMFLLKVPLRQSTKERKSLIDLIALYFLDVSGPPGFRSRLYSTGLDRQEINVRMALCMTALIMQGQNTHALFRNVESLGDQSIASWLGSALIGSRDHMWLNNHEPSMTKWRVGPQVEVTVTVMCMAAALLHHQPRQLLILPDLANIPLFLNPDMSQFPPPFDIRADIEEPGETKGPRGFKQVMRAQQEAFLYQEAISQGKWCGYYLLQQHYDLRDFTFSPPLRGIQFQCNRVAESKWEIESYASEEASDECHFSGTMEGNGEFCSCFLVRSQDGTSNEHWHGQVSPFGISGGYSIRHVNGMSSPGGLFWLWKEEWTSAALQSWM